MSPGYYNGEGQLSPKAASFSSYGKGPNAFFRIIKDWREEGSMKGMTLA